MIKYLKNKDIDRQKWDDCVENAKNSLVYGMTWYLDCVCENWDGLVLNDYEAVMPLPWKKKFGVKLSIQPMFTKELGIFSKTEISKTDVTLFIQAVPNSFLIFIHSFNTKNELENKKSALQKINQLLFLDKSYDELSRAYSKSCKYNIRRSEKYKLTISKSSQKEYISIINNLDYHYFTKKSKVLLRKLCSSPEVIKNSEFRSVQTEESKVLGVYWFLKFNNRYYNIKSAMYPEGKLYRASYKILDSFIKEKSNTNTCLDFAGSVIKGVNSFNKGFGANEVNYTILTRSHIPKFLFRI